MKIFLRENKLTDSPNDHNAVTIDTVVNNREDILLRMREKEGTILKKAEIVAAVNDFFDELLKSAAKGEGYLDEVMRIYPVVKGSFVGPEDSYDPVRHQVVASMTAGSELKRLASEIRPVKISPSLQEPYVKRAHDHKSDTNNQEITPGGTLELFGERLKMGTTAEEGVYFINEDTGLRTKTDRMITILPARLSLLVPEDLEAGKYRLEIVCVAHGCKEARTGRPDILLSVGDNH